MNQDPAFEYIRKFKTVSDETEILVKKVIKKKFPDITPNDLVTIFENGLSGEYGKMYSADPQTLIGWIEDFMKTRGKKGSYLSDGLLDPNIKITDREYPNSTVDWQKEVNKAYIKNLVGTNPSNFHPDLYDRLMMDNFIHRDAFVFFLERGGDEMAQIVKAKQITLSKFFEVCKSKGWNQIYPGV